MKILGYLLLWLWIDGIIVLGLKAMGFFYESED